MKPAPPFDFATAARIIFGAGTLQQLGSLAAEFGQQALLVTGSRPQRAAPVLHALQEAGLRVEVFSIEGEPTIEQVQRGAALAQAAEFIVACGGGSVIDAGKALAALATNPGDPLDYLEVIGKGQPLTQPPRPVIAIPTSAGTGAEVTKNAVLKSEAHQVKVSLRHPAMLPRVALIDPTLSHSLPPQVSAFTGMDALTQVIEPYVSHAANPLTDAFAQLGIQRAAQALPQVYEDGSNAAAREAMALASLCGGLALANAKLGAVHGFAGVLGGMTTAPHGVICARLLAPVTAMNTAALFARQPDHPSLPRFTQLARWLTGDPRAAAEDGITWLEWLTESLHIPRLGSYGLHPSDFPAIVEKSQRSSSMKGNPIPLTDAELIQILEKAL